VYWRAKVIVLQSGPDQGNDWKVETVNLYNDYKKSFEAEPGEVQGIAILTDSDITKSVAEADYDDFTLLSTAAAAAEKEDRTAAQLAPAKVGEP
jgi:hypothetical protein